MPEILEVESYRRHAEAVIGLRVIDVDAPDAWYLKGGLTATVLHDAVVGRAFVAARRVGKLMLLDTDGDGPTVGVRFGMTGRLIVDGRAAIDRLEYGSSRLEVSWQRVQFRFAGERAMAVIDPRRLGGVELDPDEAALGPDALSLTKAKFMAAMAGAHGPIKARLMDQGRLAGLGNLLTDEALWRARIDPARDASELDAGEYAALLRSIRQTVRVLGERGGSHTGDLQPARARGTSCPRCGGPLERRTIGGRTTFSCPRCQR
ncbi:MAG: DNA-formamidopyrimidine glycosylase family protein [Acidimicrobiales bacterium]